MWQALPLYIVYIYQRMSSNTTIMTRLNKKEHGGNYKNVVSMFQAVFGNQPESKCNI